MMATIAGNAYLCAMDSLRSLPGPREPGGVWAHPLFPAIIGHGPRIAGSGAGSRENPPTRVWAKDRGVRRRIAGKPTHGCGMDLEPKGLEPKGA